jgi:hypothetical protein
MAREKKGNDENRSELILCVSLYKGQELPYIADENAFTSNFCTNSTIHEEPELKEVHSLVLLSHELIFLCDNRRLGFVSGYDSTVRVKFLLT